MRSVLKSTRMFSIRNSKSGLWLFRFMRVRRRDMIRTIVQLTEEQHRLLKEMAAEYHTSVSELVRQGVDKLTRSQKPILSREEKIRRAMSVVGIAHDRYGATDISINHDKYLEEIYAEENQDDDDLR